MSEWWLVEVELEGHNLDEVLDQVEVFLLADLNAFSDGPYIFEQLVSRYPTETFLLPDIKSMISNNAPGVLVVVDDYREEWDERITEMGAQLCIFQVFKSTTGTEAYRVAGIYPYTILNESHCNCGDKDPRIISVNDPRSIGIKDGDEVDLIFADKSARYKAYTDRGKTLLQAVGKMNHIPTASMYAIIRDSHNRLLIKAI